MPNCLLYRNAPKGNILRFYRVEIAYTLFGDFSVLREWGVKGRSGQSLVRLFGNLREASIAADEWRETALKRGYVRCDSGSA